MIKCNKCGSPVIEGKTFCPSCGAQVTETNQQPNLGSKLQNLNNTADNTSSFSPEDIAQNKAMGILAYLGPLVLIPIFAAPNSRFARYHANQGLVLLLVEIAYSVAYWILTTIIFLISWRLYFLVSIIGLVSFVFLILSILGIINVANGSAKELPVIGKFKLLK